MKKMLLSLGLFAAVSANAQLPANSFANDFTVPAYQSWLSSAGMNSNGTYKLYDYLDAGYTVILDVSATWCGPCWNYHNTERLDDLYAAHGPAGQPGVDANTTDDVLVIWIDGDGTTADATMLDGAGGIGNWIEPTAGHQVQFPMSNPVTSIANTINDDYAIAYFPTIYKICPNRMVTEIGQMSSAAAIYGSIGQCPAPASDPADAAMTAYTAATSICPGQSYTPTVKIQNNGTAPLTNATVSITLNGTQVSTGTYTGTLATYGVATVTCSAITSPVAGALVATVTTTGDALPANGVVTTSLSIAPIATAANATVKINTDRYGAELEWNIKNSSNVTVASGGPYTNAAAAGSFPQADVNFTLVANECYTITLIDEFGDGFDGTYGDGSFIIQINGTPLLTAPNWSTGELVMKLASHATLGLEDVTIQDVSVYPNPASGIVNVAFEGNGGEYSVSIQDLSGRTVATKTLSSASGATNIELPIADLQAGNYFVSVSQGASTHTQKLMVK